MVWILATEMTRVVLRKPAGTAPPPRAALVSDIPGVNGYPGLSQWTLLLLPAHFSMEAARPESWALNLLEHLSGSSSTGSAAHQVLAHPPPPYAHQGQRSTVHCNEVFFYLFFKGLTILSYALLGLFCS